VRAWNCPPGILGSEEEEDGTGAKPGGYKTDRAVIAVLDVKMDQIKWSLQSK